MMPNSMDTITTDSRTLVMDKTISSTVTPVPSSILRSDERDELERFLTSAPRSTSHRQPNLLSPALPTVFSKDFLENDPDIARARAIYFKEYFLGLGLVILTIFIVFSIYWGSLWRVPEHALQGWIVVGLQLSLKTSSLTRTCYKDFDGGDVGRVVTQGLLNSRSWMVHWRVVPAERYPMGLNDIIQAIHDDVVWVAVTSK